MSLLDVPGVPQAALTKAMVGLSDVDNTPDAEKPVSDLQAAAIAEAGTSTATPNTVMRRDANGRASVVGPVAATHIATKGYVDTSLGLDTWPANMGTKIGFVADSNTSGFGLANPTTERWATLFCTMAAAIQNNVAVPGAGYVNEGSGGNSKFSTQATRLDVDCTHVIINGGINDAPIATQSTLQAGVNATIAAVRTRCPAARITVLSPWWMASAPSDDLLNVDSWIRQVIPSDVKYVEGGPWIRIDRTEWQQADGHPNVAGAAALAAWARDGLGGTPNGAEFAQYVLGGTSDVLLSSRSSTTPIAYTIASGTVLGAKSGFWELDGQADMYSAANGFVWVAENARKIRLRSDVTATPSVHRQIVRFYHPGGDLPVKVGYDPSNGAASIIAGGQSKITARRVGSTRA